MEPLGLAWARGGCLEWEVLWDPPRLLQIPKAAALGEFRADLRVGQLP